MAKEPSLVLCDDLEGWDRGRRGLGEEREASGGGDVYIIMAICIVIWQKPIQHCKKN